MYHKNDKKSIKVSPGTAISLLVSLVTLCTGPVIYFLLLKSRVDSYGLSLVTCGEKRGNLLMYSMPRLWCVIILSLLCALAVFALCSYITRREAPEYLPREETPEFLEEGDFTEETESPRDEALEAEYPELFSKEAEEMSEGFDHDISAFFEKEEEPAPEEPTESEADRALREFMAEGKKEEEKEDLFASLSADLPEGYELHAEPIEEEEVSAEDEPVASYSKKPLIFVILAILLISAGVSAAMSQSFNVVTEDGVLRSTLFYRTEYSLSDTASYTVASALSGDIKLTATMSDGTKIDLSPGAYLHLEAYSEKYETDFDYLTALVERLDRTEATKTVSDRASIESFYENDDGSLPDYIEKIIAE